MAYKWISTKYRGVRYREHPTRKHGQMKDRYFAIRYQKDGKRIEEGVGWASEVDPKDGENWTAAKAFVLLSTLRTAARVGEGPDRLAEKRAIAAEKKAAEEEEKRQAERDALTFGAYWESNYLPVAKTSKKKQSWGTEVSYYRHHIEPALKDLPLKDIRPLHLERIKKGMLDKQLSPRTIQYTLAVVRQVWNRARRDGYVAGEVPTAGVKIPKIDNRRMRFLTKKEIKALLDDLKIRDKQTYEMTRLSLETGLRLGEIANLKWGHVDLDAGLLYVMDPKAGRNRAAYLTDGLVSMFKGMEREEPNVHVFSTRAGEQYKNAPKPFVGAVTKLKLNEGVEDPRQRVTFHTMRHTYASNLVTAGVDLYTVKTLLGHGVLAMTERYSHLAPSSLREAVKTLENHMSRKESAGNVVEINQEAR